ncbi:MAG: FAD-dependent oxidoreductase [Gaiellaceae bacterium]
MSGDADLIVVGAGTAGMPCAIAAAEAGGSVIVVEKTSEIGGSLHLSAGSLSAAGTKRQAERAIEDDPELHVADVMRITDGTANEPLVRLAAQEAGATVDWLDGLGYAFDPETPLIYHGYEPYSRARVYYGDDLAKTIYRVLRPLWDEGTSAGKIDARVSTAMVDLIIDGERVVGVRTEGPDGVGELRAPAVVLTTGGYGSNPELFAELTPSSPHLVSATRASSTGDGILVARRYGASIAGADHYLGTIGGIEQEPGSGRSDWWGSFANVDPADRAPREIYVNAEGKRYVAEDDPSAHARQSALLKQPQRKMWAIFDEQALLDGASFVPQWDVDALRREAAAGKCVWSSDTLAGLAAAAGIGATGLAETVAAWNAAVEAGEDPVGRRDPSHAVATPPFYALLTHPVTLFTFAGLAVDGDLRVLAESGAPIEGLYAAGEVLGGAATTGNAFCTGMLVTPAISFGRILGRRLVTKAAA